MSQAPEVSNTPARRRDYYEILGLRPQAEGAEVGRAYWQLAHRYHSLTPTEPSASIMLDELNEAAEVLSTPPLRRQYDALREEALASDSGQETNERATPCGLTPHAAVTRASGRVVGLKRLYLVLAVAMVASVGTAGADAQKPKVVPRVSVRSVPIIFLGDSITHGAGASSSDTMFVQLLRQRLRDAKYAEASGDYDSVISALGGQFVDLRFSQEVGREPRSLIVVEVGAHSLVEDAGLSSRQYGFGYALMLDCLRGTGAAVVVSTVPWLGWEQTDPLYVRAAERSKIIREEAARRGIPVADVWSAMKDRRDLLAPDEFHPNDAGHRVIADLFWEQIEPLLHRPRGKFRDRCGDYDRRGGLSG